MVELGLVVILENGVVVVVIRYRIEIVLCVLAVVDLIVGNLYNGLWKRIDS